MATFEAGRGKKGKNFSADEERALCMSFLAVSQDPVCGNGQRNTAFWDRITTNYNHNKPRSCPIRPARSLESKWSHIKHDVAKFTGVFKQVSDCRESRAFAEDVLERALEYYKDRHPKQQTFVFLHCWHLLKEVPRWWQSAQEIQRRGSAGVGASAVGMATRTAAAEQQGASNGEVGEPAEEPAEVVVRQNFPARPTRPQGNKAAKANLSDDSRRDSILKTQALATEQMAVANMRKAEAMSDHTAMSLFRMPIEECDDEAREYFKLRRKLELERIKRRMEHENREAEREKLDHEKLLRERAADEHRSKRLRQHANPPAETQPNATPIPPPEPQPTPTIPAHPNLSLTPAATPQEDSPIHTDLGECLFFFTKLMLMNFQCSSLRIGV